MTDHDHDDGPHGFAFAVPIPAAAVAARERRQMEAQDLAAGAYRLVESMTPDQLMGLRWILNQDHDSASNNYWDGMCVALLRSVHHVDPTTGLDPIAALDRTGNGRG